MGANRKYFDVRVFKGPLKFASVIYHEGSLEDAKNSQNEILAELDNFQKYNPKKQDTIEEKTEVLINAERLCNIRSKVLKHLKTEFFHVRMDFKKKCQIWSIKNCQIG